MKFIILANGDHTRFGPFPKQLLEFDGETLLDRMHRQFSPYGDIVVVTKHPEVRGCLEFFDPGPTGAEVETICKTPHLWDTEERTTLLLGDCYFTDSAVEIIATCKKPFCQFGRRRGWGGVKGGEVFSASWTAEMNEEIEAMVKRVKSGNQWHLFCAMHDWDCNTKAGLGYLYIETDKFIDLQDKSTDIDWLWDLKFVPATPTGRTLELPKMDGPP